MGVDLPLPEIAGVLTVPHTMKHQYADSSGSGCTCNVKRKSLFNLIHFQSGVHKRGCPKSTKLDDLLRREASE